MVGAGFSKFARLASQDGRSPPLWSDFELEMRKRLHEENLPADPLKLAEQYAAALGRHALDALIREFICDHQWTPGEMHSRLLGLPWADVLTTNWDTLLERTQLREPDRTYEIVRVISDIARTRAPRIVKLHGSLPSYEPFIFTSEDFRTYPKRFAPFMNLAQQVLLENELCLVGFSGDDPNFLEWSGWVRDQLGASARKIRLIGVLNLSPSRRQVLEHHNIAPIDLAPLVEAFDASEKRHHAIKIFIDLLWAAKPKPNHVWTCHQWRGGPTVSLTTQVEAEAFLHSLLVKWRDDRRGYPGWLVAPYSERMMVRQYTSSDLRDVLQALTKVTATTRSMTVYELIWRYEIALSPVPGELVKLIYDVLQEHESGLTNLQQNEMQLTLLRAARRRRDWPAFDELAGALGALDRTNIKEALAYERALRCRDEMDFDGLAEAANAVSGDDPVWAIRRSALQCVLGEDKQAAETLLAVWNEIKSRRAQDRQSIWLLSREAWTAWLMRRARFSLRDRQKNDDDEYQRWPVKYKAADCDPWDETTYFDHELSAEFDRQMKASETIQPRFDAGTYRDQSRTVHFRDNTSVFQQLAILSDHVGLADKIDHVDVLGSRFVRSLELAKGAVDFVWPAVLHLPGASDGLIDRYFSRIAVALLPFNLVSAIAIRLRHAIDYGRKRFTNTDWVSCTVRHTELLSRLVVRLPPDEALQIFEWAITLSEDSHWDHWWLFEPLGNF